MERLKAMKESLICCVQGQIQGNLKDVDTKELGEAVDMIKDLEEAIYYHTITKAMEGDKEESYRHADYGRMYYDEEYYERPMKRRDKKHGQWYDRDADMEMREREVRHETYPVEMRDHREGRSPVARKSYMEVKELNHDTKTKMHELEKYMQELSQDIVEMIADASPEEKQMLQQKLNTLSTKIK